MGTHHYQQVGSTNCARGLIMPLYPGEIAGMTLGSSFGFEDLALIGLVLNRAVLRCPGVLDLVVVVCF